MRYQFILGLGLTLFLCSHIVQGQIPTSCEQFLENAPTALADLSNSSTCFWELALRDKTSFDAALKAQAAVQKNSTTTQMGAPSNSNGSTSAISKPNTVFSLASEYGGITSSTSNQTVTLQATLDGIPQAIAQHGGKPYCWSTALHITCSGLRS